MKRLFYLTLAACACIGCHNEADLTPPVGSTGEVQLQVKNAPQGSILDGQFVFGSGDQVRIDAQTNGQLISNTFTYDGNRWTQDAPKGNYKNILWQDDLTILNVVSYGGKPAAPASNTLLDQSSEDKYIAASELIANEYWGSIEMLDGLISARLDHINADLALKVYDGYDANNTLDEDTPTLTVIVDKDGSSMGSVTATYTAWNAGKHTDENGDTYTLFRVQLPYHCSILEATLQHVNDVAGDEETEIYFRAPDGQPSNEIDLERGKRYNASYTYDVQKTVATLNISITPFEGTPTNDLSANNGWTFDHNTKTYTVFTAEGLQQVNQTIANNITTKAAYNITLGADITLPDPVAPETSNWIPLGYEVIDWDNYIYKKYPYSGVFDGAGHTISNLRINNDDTENLCVGLIGLIGDGGAVKNLTLDNPKITSTGACVGGLVGYFDTSVESSFLITNCHITGGSIKSASEVGGIAGRYIGDIIACTVSGTTIEGDSKVGGIIGFQHNGRIVACGVDGVNLRCSDNWFGGIAGFWGATSLSQSPGYMYSCYAKDCTKGTDSQALEGTANLLGVFGVNEGYSLTAKNCAYRPKGGTITYGIGGTMSGPTGNLLSSELFTETGTADSDWPTASRDLNVGIDEWNGFDPTLPCNWEWNTSTTEEGKLKAR